MKKQTSSLGWLLSLITLTAVVLASYLGYLQYLTLNQRLADLEQAQQSSVSQRQEVRQQLSTISQSYEQQLQALQSRYQADMKNLTDQLLASAEKIAEMEGATQSAWQVDEAFYLLKMANNRLILMEALSALVIQLGPVAYG